MRVGDARQILDVSCQSIHTPIMVTLKLNGAPISIELDTGAGISIVSKQIYDQLRPESKQPPIRPSSINLKTYTGEKLPVLGVTNVVAEYKQQSEKTQLHIADGSGPSLFRKDWLLKIKLDWHELHYLSGTDQQLDKLLSKHGQVFKDELGIIKGTTAKFAVDKNARPCFCNFRSIPFALRNRVEQELDHLQKAGVIEPIQFSDWAASIVPVIKPNGSIRICGDFKLTVNKVAKLDTYYLPKVDDLFSQLAGGKCFSKLDLAYAYLQIALEEESKQYVVINTHKGLYRYNHLPFRVHSAPAIFQRTIESILRERYSTRQHLY